MIEPIDLDSIFSKEEDDPIFNYYAENPVKEYTNYTYLRDTHKTIDALNEDLFWSAVDSHDLHHYLKRYDTKTDILERGLLYRIKQINTEYGPIIPFINKIAHYLGTRIVQDIAPPILWHKSDYKSLIGIYCVYKGKKYYYKAVDILINARVVI